MGGRMRDAVRRAGTSVVSDMLDDLRRMMREVEALPPRPSRVMAHHAVPYGRCYKQWMTNGELWLWANRGELADLPHKKWGPVELLVSDMVLPGLFGIPVVIA